MEHNSTAEYHSDKVAVTGSNPVAPIMKKVRNQNITKD